MTDGLPVLLAVALQLAVIYGAVVCTLSGFAFMIGGPTKAGAVVTALLLAPLRRLFLHSVALLAHGLVAAARMVLHRVIDPALLGIEDLVRAILFPRR